MKKVLALIVAVALCAAFFTACASSTPAASSAAPSESAAASVAASEPAAASESAAPSEAAATGKIADIKAAGKLVMMTNAAFAPYEYLGSDNQVAGVDVDMAQAIADKLEVELEVVNMDFDGLIPALVAGKGDLVAAGLTITDERKQSVDFSDPYADATQLIIVKSDNTEIKGPDDLKGKTIGVQLGTTGDIYSSDIEGAEVKQYKTGIEAGMDLKNGKLDAVVLDKLPAQNIVDSNEGLILIDAPLTDEEYAIAVNKGDAEFLALINGVIKDLQAAGSVAEWTEKHAQEAAVASPSPSES
jgi:ABC-type amino acid transport substrate-binding protein